MIDRREFWVARLKGESSVLSVLRWHQEWGLRSIDLVGPPRRFWADGEVVGTPIVDMGVDAGRVESVATPAALLAQGAIAGTWAAMTRRSVARLRAFFLLSEDPQRRLDARGVNTLAHQMSLVRHILDTPSLKRVLVADEVGLGKTIEAGLLIRELLQLDARMRVLYLAPARLVNNVRRELDRLELPFRQWTAADRDARLEDQLVIASIHKAVHGSNAKKLLASGVWDVIVVDECHHLSDWEPGGGNPREKYRLVRDLLGKLDADARVILLSGTPHQGHEARFENLLDLLREPGESADDLVGRVIYRTKEDVADWDGRPIFPGRQINSPIVFDGGPRYREWLSSIHEFFSPDGMAGEQNASRRAAGWKCAQALQWAASSPQAGLGYLVRQAIRAKWAEETRNLGAALRALRPYRDGFPHQSVSDLFARIKREVGQQDVLSDVEDIEESDASSMAAVDHAGLERLISQGLSVLAEAGDSKWDLVKKHVLDPAGDEKVVLFAQPIETVTAFAGYLERIYGVRPAVIMGGQSDQERRQEIERFCQSDGPRFLVSSRAGGEGINLQVARRLVHIDVPWNPMELEQRVGRVHRFGSRAIILVDTLVMRDSREEEAYAAADKKLRMITRTLVTPDRFDELFSRVMALIPPEELQEVLLKRRGIDAAIDSERIGQLVQEGFNRWKTFHGRYSAEQRKIRDLNPGSAAWEDVFEFLCEYAGARPIEGFYTLGFSAERGGAHGIQQPARVLTFDGKDRFACGDYAGTPVHGSEGQSAQQLGLNLPEVAAALRRVAFPDDACGAAHIRWPKDLASLPGLKYPFSALVLMRQQLRMEHASWHEGMLSLFCYVVARDGKPILLDGHDREQLLRGIFRATVRVKPDEGEALALSAAEHEQELMEQLRQITRDEFDEGMRYAVMPLFAAVVSAPASS